VVGVWWAAVGFKNNNANPTRMIAAETMTPIRKMYPMERSIFSISSLLSIT
jgi:hypothetical protein